MFAGHQRYGTKTPSERQASEEGRVLQFEKQSGAIVVDLRV